MVKLSTVSATNITYTSCLANGTIFDMGSSDIIQHGFCWSETSNPTTNSSNKKLGSISSAKSFSSNLTGLTAGRTYYIRAFVQNSEGTFYGGQVQFETPAYESPTVATSSISNITQISAQGGGNVTSDGGTPVIVRGICWSTSLNPTIEDFFISSGFGTGAFSGNLTGLSCGNKYYVRAFAENSSGINYGSQVSFTTDPCPTDQPSVETSSISAIGVNSATCGGNVTDDGGATVTVRGVCWSTSSNPEISDSHTTNGEGTGSFTSYMSALSPDTKYYVRAYATNINGTAYGNEVSFITLTDPTKVYDYDRNAYNIIKIGNQYWMKENLKTTHYADGRAIDNGTGAGDIGWNTSKEYWFVHNDDIAKKATYGLLYTWGAAMNGSAGSNTNPSGVQGVCPNDWHLPSDAEWKELELYLGMSLAEADKEGWRGTDEGGKLKETGFTHWISPNDGATNSSGFTALPGSFRNDDGDPNEVGYFAYFWSSTEYGSNIAWGRSLFYDDSDIQASHWGTNDGFSVRCVKDD